MLDLQMLKKFWNDTVWSKVIATMICALGAMIYAFGEKYIDNLWLIITIVVIPLCLLLSILYVVRKRAALWDRPRLPILITISVLGVGGGGYYYYQHSQPPLVSIAFPCEFLPIPAKVLVHGSIQKPPDGDDRLWLFVRGHATKSYWVYPIILNRSKGTWLSDTARFGPQEEERTTYTISVWLADRRIISWLEDAAEKSPELKALPQGVTMLASKEVRRCEGELDCPHTYSLLPP
jgi:hypothetical protein